ncbi:MAG: hypothetical protein J0L64_20325 [Acidobacteria bacterium]|nr:hypothetical protein [Acidobacteriota bacterium]
MNTFDAAYSHTRQNAEAEVSVEGLEVAHVRQLIRQYGGTSYEGGLYWILNGEDARMWTIMVRRCFPAESAGVEAFGRDWQGNVFGYRGGGPCVILYQPGTGDVFEVSDSLDRFHNEELTEHAEEALSLSLWNEWRRSSPAPDRSQCVAYKKPLFFLGGDVTVENLSIANMDVYWEVMCQLLQQIRELPEGTPINLVKLTYLE